MAKPDWITLSKNSGSGNDTISVEAQPNASEFCREGVITVNSGNGSISKQIKVEQLGNPSFKIKLYFVGTETGSGGPMTINSYYCVLTSLIPVTAYNHLIVEASVYQADGSILSFPEQTGGISSADPTILKFPIYLSSLSGGSDVGTCNYQFAQPLNLLSVHGLYFKEIKAYSTPNKKYVIGDKSQSTVRGEAEFLEVDASSIPMEAAGGNYTINVDTQNSVTWTVE